MKILKIIFPFEDFLYILQLEEYDNARFAKRLKQFFFKRNLQKRDTLKFTSRIQTTLVLSVGIYILSLPFAFLMPWFLIISTLLIPVYVLIANNLLTPFYELMKYRLQVRAAKKVQTLNNLKIIAIAGSYGKTTTKNFIYQIIKFSSRVQMVPGNINTPTGIAAWVLKELQNNTDTLLVEMDSYFLGEIKRSCMVVPPDIAIITSIGDQHIERFGNQKKMAQAIFEVFKYAKENASLYMLTSEQSKLKKFSINENLKINLIKTKKLKTNVTSNSALVDLNIAVKVCEDFGVQSEIINDSIKNLELPDRRQKPVEINGYEAIDDSYNISATTAREGVEAALALAKKHKKKLLVITAGIPELGPDSLDENKKYGEFLEKKADQVIVLKSMFHKDLVKENFLLCNDLKEAWKKIEEKFPSSKYLLLIQPELTDLYY